MGILMTTRLVHNEMGGVPVQPSTNHHPRPRLIILLLLVAGVLSVLYYPYNSSFSPAPVLLEVSILCLSLLVAYGRVLHCLWSSPEEGVAFGVGFWNRSYYNISHIQHDTIDGRTLCSWLVRKRLPITMVSYLHALHGT